MTKPSSAIDQSATPSKKKSALTNEWRRLTLEVRATPENFELHSRRIMFALQNKMTRFLSGALQDLFIALDGRGQVLRDRMHRLTLPLMQQHEREYLNLWAEANSDAALLPQHLPGSSLSGPRYVNRQGLIDSFEMPASGSAIERASEAITHGHIEEACDLLEDACRQGGRHPDPKNMEALLYLYSQARTKQPLLAFADYLRQQRFKLPKSWKQVIESSHQW